MEVSFLKGFVQYALVMSCKIKFINEQCLVIVYTMQLKIIPGYLPLEVVFHWRSSSIKGFFHRGGLPFDVISHYSTSVIIIPL